MPTRGNQFTFAANFSTRAIIEALNRAPAVAGR